MKTHVLIALIIAVGMLLFSTGDLISWLKCYFGFYGMWSNHVHFEITKGSNSN